MDLFVEDMFLLFNGEMVDDTIEIGSSDQLEIVIRKEY